MKNKECPECRRLGRDSKGDHLFLMEDGVTWCCNKTEIHPLYLEKEGGEFVKDNKKLKYRITPSEILNLPMIGSKDRAISKEVHARFGVRTEFNESTGEPRAVYYPETVKGKPSGFKVRDLPKSFYTRINPIYADSIPDLFGEPQCPKSGKRVVLCAGEEDTLAAAQMLLDKYPDYEPAVLGIPRGEGSLGAVAEKKELLNGFEQVIICMDNDEAGKKAEAKLVTLIGEKARVMCFSEKDISDMRVKGKEKEWINSYFSAKEYRPSTVIAVSDILEQAVTPVPWGLTYPWTKLTKLTYGMKEKGEIVGIGAAPGAGKTTLWQMMQKHLIFNHRVPIAVYDIEEGEQQALKKLIGSVMNLPIHKPDCEYDIDEARRIGQEFEGLVQFYGGDSENWEEVEDSIRYFASKGIRFFFIDPLSALVEHLSASEGNTELGRIMRAMRKFRKHQGLTFFHANHLNNPSSGKEHGEGGAVRGSQFSGSRAQWKYSTLLLGYERNQYSDSEEEKHKGVLRVLKDRLGGNTGIVNMEYIPSTGLLIQEEIPTEF